MFTSHRWMGMQKELVFARVPWVGLPDDCWLLMVYPVINTHSLARSTCLHTGETFKILMKRKMELPNYKKHYYVLHANNSRPPLYIKGWKYCNGSPMF